MTAWMTVIEKLAPTIATGLSGPLAVGAVGAIEKVFGLAPLTSATVADRQTALATAISGATSDQLIGLKKADQDYAASMAQAGFKDIASLASLVTQDSSTGNSNSAFTVPPAPGAIMLPVFTLVATIGFFGMLLLLLFVNVPEANKAILFSFTGTLGTVWVAAAHFWFGDTQASGRKTELLAQSTPPA